MMNREKPTVVLILLKVLLELFVTLWKFYLEIDAHKENSVHLKGDY